MRDARRTPRIGRGVRQSLWHAARARSKRRSRPGRDVLFDIDWQGTQQLAQAMEERSGAHVHPAALGGGAARAADPAAPRIHRPWWPSAWPKPATEISHWPEYDYVIVNTTSRMPTATIDAHPDGRAAAAAPARRAYRFRPQADERALADRDAPASRAEAGRPALPRRAWSAGVPACVGSGPRCRRQAP